MERLIILFDKMVTQEEFAKSTDIIERLEKISLPIKELGKDISYRQLVYWNSEGLLLSDPQKDKLKEVNFTGYCWIHIVNIMRSYGMSISIIKAIKEALLGPIDWLMHIDDQSILDKFLNLLPEEEKPGFLQYIKELKSSPEKRNDISVSALYMMIVDYLIFRDPISILVNTNGQSVVLVERELKEYNELPAFQSFYRSSYLKIAFSEIVRAFIKVDESEIKDYQLQILSESEADILRAIRQGSAKEITIKFKNRKPEMLEITKEQTADSSIRIVDLMMKNGYQDIELKTQNGQVIYCANTVKKKLSTKNE